MESAEPALLRWLSKAVNKPDLQLVDLAESRILFDLVTRLHHPQPVQYTTPNPKLQPWQAHYMNFKTITLTIQSYYKKILQSSLPSDLPSINLLSISKGEDKQGLLTILVIIFIGCVNGQKYIEEILKLQEAEQAELMKLIQDKKLNAIQVVEDLGEVEVQQVQRSRIDQYLFRIQSLAAENDSLTNQLIAQSQQKTKLKDQIQRLQQESKKIKRQLDQKTLYIHQKQQQQQQQQSTKRTISDSNQQIIQLLRKQLVQQQQQHLQQKKKIQDKLETITQQLTLAQNKIIQLQNQDLMGLGNGNGANRKIQHQDCVSVNQHKNVTQKLHMKVKNLEQKQTELEREVLRGKYEFDELARKFKKQESEKENLKQEFEKVSKNTSMIPIKQAQKLKLTILQAIKDKLKARLEATTASSSESQGTI